MSGNICHRCSKAIEEGGLFYHVKLTAISGFDGILPDTNDSVSSVLEHIDDKNPRELEMDIYYEQEVLLCMECKEEVTEQFLTVVGLKGPIDPDGPGGRLH